MTVLNSKFKFIFDCSDTHLQIYNDIDVSYTSTRDIHSIVYSLSRPFPDPTTKQIHLAFPVPTPSSISLSFRLQLASTCIPPRMRWNSLRKSQYSQWDLGTPFARDALQRHFSCDLSWDYNQRHEANIIIRHQSKSHETKTKNRLVVSSVSAPWLPWKRNTVSEEKR